MTIRPITFANMGRDICGSGCFHFYGIRRIKDGEWQMTVWRDSTIVREDDGGSSEELIQIANNHNSTMCKKMLTKLDKWKVNNEAVAPCLNKGTQNAARD